MDHGPSVETSQAAKDLFEAYRKVRASGRHILAKPGDRIPIKGPDVEILSAAGDVISAPLAGAGPPNPLCAEAQRGIDDPGENGQSIGMVIRYGKFRLLDLGDLSWTGSWTLPALTTGSGRSTSI